MMNSKDYDLLAKVVNSQQLKTIGSERYVIADLVHELTKQLHYQNPNFLEGKFIESCGLDDIMEVD
jgi:hypothetical protein